MINDIKDLKTLFKLCRAQGITSFKMNGIEISFGNLPIEKYTIVNDEFESDELQGDDLIYYSTPQGQAELDKKVGIAK
jgi:hypothetical protein